MNMASLKEFFMWYTIVNFGMLLFSTALCMVLKGFIQRIHGKLFDLNENTINAFLYGYLGLYKILFILFCLMPYIALTIIS